LASRSHVIEASTEFDATEADDETEAVATDDTIATAPALSAADRTKGNLRVKRYLVDTGSPNDLVGLDCTPKGASIKKLPKDGRLNLDTAGGAQSVD
jgi:hypothetical protein